MILLQISNIKLGIEKTEEDAYEKALKIAGLMKRDVISWKILKYSVDARNQSQIHKIYTLGIYVASYYKSRKNVRVVEKEKKYSYVVSGKQELKSPPVVIGFGPAGMFAAYLLACGGYRPVIIERGGMVEERTRAVEKFWQTGDLDLNCNVQFGEGGAGTFSDGKLNTGIKDKENRIQFVLETFVKFGADEKILYDAKPHIGTDVLKKVVQNMRKYILEKGGTFYFHTALKDITYEHGSLCKLILSNGKVLETDLCILAIGHSARDTFEMLYKKGVIMEQKPFAIGVRVEHSQKKINQSQYGFEDNRLGAASYKLTYKTKKNRGVYSFCMCPGGYVVDASSENEMKVVNGMSYAKRNGENANSAIVVTVSPKDFPKNHPLSGMEYQRELEKRAYMEGKGQIPIQRYGDFKKNRTTDKLGTIKPQIKGKYSFANLNHIFPQYITEALIEGMEYFGTKIRGFHDEDVVLSAVETRTSSPVRILRDEEYQSNVAGLMPAGEGAGYAGGITSAAIDGMKISEFIAGRYKIPQEETK